MGNFKRILQVLEKVPNGSNTRMTRVAAGNSIRKNGTGNRCYCYYPSALIGRRDDTSRNSTNIKNKRNGAKRMIMTTSTSYPHKYKHHQSFSSRTISSTTNNDDVDSRLVSIHDDKDLIDQIPLEDVRNFCFIAHVDHGKSSLSSRLLEYCGNLGKDAQIVAKEAANKSSGSDSNNDQQQKSPSNESTKQQQEQSSKKEQFELLDTLTVEQERGITVKATTAAMLYRHKSAVGPKGVLLLNMIDTPGHADFGREVQRSLSFVDGAVLLLDAAQGIQAQTWSVHERVKSLKNPPKLLVALTKVDLDAAKPIRVALAVSEWLSWDDPDDILITSARNRVGIKDVLDAVSENIPSPTPMADDVDNDSSSKSGKGKKGGGILRARVVDSWYDSRGVNCLVQIISGVMSEGDRISIVKKNNENKNNNAQNSYSVQEVGMVLPLSRRTGALRRGHMGYVRFGLRDPRQARPGTLLTWDKYASKDKLDSILLPEGTYDDDGTNKSVLYASVHPSDATEFEELSTAVEKLALNDTGLEVSRTSSIGGGNDTNNRGGGPFLGPGLRVGFQGLLHVEVFRQRLFDEFNLDAVVTAPKVPYEVTFLGDNNKGGKGKKKKKNEKQNDMQSPHTKLIEDLSEWPEEGTKFIIKEPMVDVRIMAPVEYAGSVMDLLSKKRATRQESNPIDDETWLFTGTVPWGEVVTDFHDQLKTTTAGYGSLDTSESDPPYEKAKLSKIDIYLNNEIVEPLSFVCHKDAGQSEARIVCKKLQEVLPRQQFVTVIQAKVDGTTKIIASERIRAYRKDVLIKSGKVVGGGDTSRKKKLLDKQKKGKKMQQETGRVSLSQSAFNSVITRGQ